MVWVAGVAGLAVAGSSIGYKLLDDFSPVVWFAVEGSVRSVLETQLNSFVSVEDD